MASPRPAAKLSSHPSPQNFCNFIIVQQRQGPEWRLSREKFQQPQDCSHVSSALILGSGRPLLAFFFFPLFLLGSALGSIPRPQGLAGEGRVAGGDRGGGVSKHATWSGSQLLSRWLLVWG